MCIPESINTYNNLYNNNNHQPYSSSDIPDIKPSCLGSSNRSDSYWVEKTTALYKVITVQLRPCTVLALTSQAVRRQLEWKGHLFFRTPVCSGEALIQYVCPSLPRSLLPLLQLYYLAVRWPKASSQTFPPTMKRQTVGKDKVSFHPYNQGEGRQHIERFTIAWLRAERQI